MPDGHNQHPGGHADGHPSGRTPRHWQKPWVLLGRAAGPPWLWPGKGWRLMLSVWHCIDTRELDKKLGLLQRRGVIEAIPTRWQLIVGSYDMVRFWIHPAAVDYYRRSGFDYTFHQLLRFADEPAAVTDPVGLLASRDDIIGHVLQVVHANPAYDMQLLSMFEDGLLQMERQTRAMVAGTHHRARAIGAIVEEPDYHQRLLAFVREWRQTGTAAPLLRENIVANPRFAELELVFGSLTGAMRYFCSLPTNLRGALRHIRRVDEFGGHLSLSERQALLAGTRVS